MGPDTKWQHLLSLLRETQTAVIAYSGGVDSSLLLKAAAGAMGPNLIAVTAVSETYPSGELAQAGDFTRTLGVRHRVLQTGELSSEEFTRNSPDRCYFCKKELFTKLKQIADCEGIAAILEGSNVDDLRDRRPGRRAAEEFSVRSPLVEAGLTKAEVRELAHANGLFQWDKPSLACLSSRIPYGTRITTEALSTIQAAEEALRGLGLRQVRVRHYGDTARIEVEREDLGKLVAGDAAARITRSLKELGYTYVCLDLEGYRTGSMNERLKGSHESNEFIESKESKESEVGSLQGPLN